MQLDQRRLENTDRLSHILDCFLDLLFRKVDLLAALLAFQGLVLLDPFDLLLEFLTACVAGDAYRRISQKLMHNDLQLA